MSDKQPKTPVELAIEALERFRPCDHPEYEECGAAGMWRTCSACGLQFASERHEGIRSRASEFDAALSSLRSMDSRLTLDRESIKNAAREWILAHDGPESEDDAEHILEDLVERLTQSAKP